MCSAMNGERARLYESLATSLPVAFMISCPSMCIDVSLEVRFASETLVMAAQLVRVQPSD